MANTQARFLWYVFLGLAVLTAVAAGWAHGHWVSGLADPLWVHALRYAAVLVSLGACAYVVFLLSTLNRNFVAGKIPVGVYRLDHSERYKRGDEGYLSVTYRPHRSTDGENIHERRIINLPISVIVPHAGPTDLFEIRATSVGVAIALLPRDLVGSVEVAFPAEVTAIEAEPRREKKK